MIGRGLVCVVLLSLCGQLSAEDDFPTLMMRATVKLNHELSTATGFVLRQSRPNQESRSILVTAAHVIEKMTGNDAKLMYRVREAEGTYKKEAMPLVIRRDGQPTWVKHPTEDVALMVITPPEKSDIPELSTDLLADDDRLRQSKIHPGQIVVCLGYPHRVEANEAGFPILRTGSIGSFPLVPAKVNKTFLLSANTFEGDSGGPIFVTDSHRKADGSIEEIRMILGLMHGQHFLDEDMVMIYGSTKLRHRLGLGIVVQAAFIRETLQQIP